ncbi:hypothetical protein DFO54_104155 [Erwinia sp. AG740]|nr:hypothetical protein DFO54_104155 [Erwinia sp. AG740]
MTEHRLRIPSHVVLCFPASDLRTGHTYFFIRVFFTPGIIPFRFLPVRSFCQSLNVKKVS